MRGWRKLAYYYYLSQLGSQKCKELYGAQIKNILLSGKSFASTEISHFNEFYIKYGR